MAMIAEDFLIVEIVFNVNRKTIKTHVKVLGPRLSSASTRVTMACAREETMSTDPGDSLRRHEV